MKNRQTLSAVLLTSLIAALAYVGISRGPVARQASPAGLALGQAPTPPPARLAKPPAVALPVPVAANDPFPFRLKNTDSPIGELVRNETAVLLRNAFIDTALGSGLAIPAEFKTTGDPLTYIAQARGPATAAFRRHIAASGGKIISYIPNNAYLVRVDAAGAARLANWPMRSSASTPSSHTLAHPSASRYSTISSSCTSMSSGIGSRWPL